MTNCPQLKVITLNVHRSKHLDLIQAFLQREQPDVLCVQELCASDIPLFRAIAGEQYQTVPLTIYSGDAEACLFSIGIFSRHPIMATSVQYYSGTEGKLQQSVAGDETTINRAFLSGDVVKEGETFRIGTTHFTWTPDGEANATQRRDLQNLLEILQGEREIVFMGDFNAPRGREIFSRIAERYKDNIPSEYTTSIDGTFHRAGALPLMVDGIFSTPAYVVSDVRMVEGVSDHCAFVAEVQKVG